MDHPVRWLLLNAKLTFARSALPSVARKSLAATTVFAVTDEEAGAVAGVRCRNPNVIGAMSANDRTKIRDVFMTADVPNKF